MEVKIEDLVSGTVFTTTNTRKKYKKDNSCWSTESPTFPKDKLIGNGDNPRVVSCIPLLGGEYQDKLKCWIRLDSLVDVE